jgi:hypothetical protein
VADRPPELDTGDDAGVRPDRGSTTGAPRWVKVFAASVLVLALVIVVMIVTGRGGHGPGRHTAGGGSHTPPSAQAQQP